MTSKQALLLVKLTRCGIGYRAKNLSEYFYSIWCKARERCVTSDNKCSINESS